MSTPKRRRRRRTRRGGASKRVVSKPVARSTKVHVYTCGYCRNNHQRGSRSGYGVHVRDQLPLTDYNGNDYRLTTLSEKQNSAVASLLAVEHVLASTTMPQTPLQRRLRKYLLNPRVTVVVHTDTADTASWCTVAGKQLADEGFPPRPSIDTIRRVYELVRARMQTRAPSAHKTLEIVASPKTGVHARGAKYAKVLAKKAVDFAVDTHEKETFFPMSGCLFDDDRRVYLKVPPHENGYAMSKGAWWNLDEHKFFLYPNPDVGCHYDMCQTDYTNLIRLYT